MIRNNHLAWIEGIFNIYLFENLADSMPEWLRGLT